MISRIIGQLISSFLLLNFVRKYKSRSSLMKIKAARMYVLGVKKIRIFFLGVFFVLIAFVFLINGLCLIQSALFTYSLWSAQTRFIISLLLGCFELSGAMIVLYFLFREETWVRFYGIQRVINSVIDEKSKLK